MLKADSSDEKSESELHRSARRRRRERGGVPLDGVDEADDRLHRLAGKDVLEVGDERARRVGLVEEPEDGQREEDERHEGRQGEVRDHRRECVPRSLKNRSNVARTACMGQFASFGRRHGRFRRSLRARRGLDPGGRGRDLRPQEVRRLARRESAPGRSPRTGPSSSPSPRRSAPTAPRCAEVHVDLDRGSLAVASDGVRTVVATTVAEPTVGLLAHDLPAVLARLRGDES